MIGADIVTSFVFPSACPYVQSHFVPLFLISMSSPRNETPLCFTNQLL